MTGRYIQSDPIGFDGGVNTFLYADANPLVKYDEIGENPVAIARALLGAAVKKCAKNKVCRYRAMYAAYKSVCWVKGCGGNDSCAENIFKTSAALMCFTWRSAYIKMKCDKYIPTTKNHPEAARQAGDKWQNCLRHHNSCCSDSILDYF